MKLKLRQTTVMLAALFTLSLSAHGSESNQAPTTSLGSESSTILTNKKLDAEPASIDPNIILKADKILAEEAETNAGLIDDSFHGTSNPLETLRSTSAAGSLVSRWLEKHARDTNHAAESKTRHSLVAGHSHAHYQDIETDMGGGWCDYCGCWLRHGSDPNGTPEELIGHLYRCTGGGSNSSCSYHPYQNCIST